MHNTGVRRTDRKQYQQAYRARRSSAMATRDKSGIII